MNGASKNKRAFTLVELLVVIAVIALIMSILLPALRRARNSANRLICSTNMNQISLALRAYAADNSDKVIHAGEILYTHSAQEVRMLWNIALLPYVDVRVETDLLKNAAQTWFCPADKDPYPLGFKFNPHTGMTSYALNGYHENTKTNGRNVRLGPGGGYKFSQVPSPADCMLMGETSYASQFYDNQAPQTSKYNIRNDGHHRMTSGFYHDGSMNVLYTDGHVKAFRGIDCEKEDRWIPPKFDNGKHMFFPELRLQRARENRLFWGPGY
jgi:prepilin-type N-terminal cleavage/methylation domain-containing protein/prepilin-type processing-associated H-X9-DG protein